MMDVQHGNGGVGKHPLNGARGSRREGVTQTVRCAARGRGGGAGARLLVVEEARWRGAPR